MKKNCIYEIVDGIKNLKKLQIKVETTQFYQKKKKKKGDRGKIKSGYSLHANVTPTLVLRAMCPCSRSLNVRQNLRRLDLGYPWSQPHPYHTRKSDNF